MIVPANKRVIKREDDYSLPTISKPGSTGDTNARKEFLPCLLNNLEYLLP